MAPRARSELPDDLDLRARMHFEVEDREADIEVVARSVPGELVVVGITNYGVRVFAARQRGRSITVEGAATREYEHLARWTMDALHRSLWIHAPPDGPDAASAPVVAWKWESERVVERLQDGERRREFSRSGASATVSVRYRERAIEIRNPWCGYRVVFVRIDDAGREEPFRE